MSARCTTRATTASSAVSWAPRTSSVAQRSAASLRAAGSTSPVIASKRPGAGEHRPVVAGTGVLGHRRPAYDPVPLLRCRGGGSASVASSTSIPVICSRSTMIERIWASTTSADRSGDPLDLGGALADPQQRRRAPASGHLAGRQRVGHLVDGVGEVLAQQDVGPRERLVVVGGSRHPPHQHPGVAQRPVERLDELDHPADVAGVPAPER